MRMKKLSQIIRLMTLLTLCINYNDVIYCQDNKPDTVLTTIFELEHGCKLVLDPNSNTTDSLILAIINGINSVLPRIQELIPADSVTINLTISRENILPQFGMGGGSSNDRVNFFFDPKNPNFNVDFMLHSLAHELQHVVRLRMPQWHLTLLECMITEGLSDHFMIEVFNCEIPKWSQAITEDEIKKYLILVKPFTRIKHETWDEEFNENYFIPWMFGRNGDNPIPGWTGYTLGWRIVENYLKAHPEVHASSLVFSSPEEIAGSTPELEVDNENK
jgi:uncharacterized protein YjaZ